MKLNPKKRRALRISNRWTTPTETPASIPLSQMKPQKTRSPLGVNTSIFLFGTTSTACDTTTDKQPRDEDTTVYSSETQSMFHQRIRKHNRRKPTSMMRHRIWLKIQSPNNDKQTASPPQHEEGKRLVQSPNKVTQKPTGDNIKLFLNNSKPKKIQNTRQIFSLKEPGANTNTQGHKFHL